MKVKGGLFLNDQRALHELREGVGLTQSQFAKILGISDKTLWIYERDSSNIPNRILSKVLYLFNISYDEIFLGPKYDLIVLRKNNLLNRLEEEDVEIESINTNTKK